MQGLRMDADASMRRDFNGPTKNPLKLQGVHGPHLRWLWQRLGIKLLTACPAGSELKKRVRFIILCAYKVIWESSTFTRDLRVGILKLLCNYSFLAPRRPACQSLLLLRASM